MDFSSEYLKSIFGAFSITRTVVYHYFEGLPNHLQEDELLDCFRELCEHFELADHGTLLLSSVFENLQEFRKDRTREISQEEFAVADNRCKEYVNWVFNHFNCFVQTEDGGFVYRSNG